MSAPSRAGHALFAGTFDPFTVGHLGLVRRASVLFGRVTVGIALNPDKQHLFSDEERVELAREATAGIAGVEVRAIDGLLVHACEALGADVIVRGVRSGTDFDYEVQMARTNRAMLARIDTVLLVPDPGLAHVSSSLVRQIARMGGEVAHFVPACVERALRRRFPAANPQQPSASSRP
jgi:pantetheine-phosphate adenylyltransferase